ncbi:cell division protein FtsQ/DivIB [Cyclobacterium plantarum]|uniref:Cell division protein n=1 Tax=Cyclobacterium plantarum TaxID=2716263 RepID=A0ABX0HCF2_9BACT|nr:cell division protein [Cyclobacterium plantarum]NHE58024.1 cell division protein [Cyclobacterium plantarum]
MENSKPRKYKKPVLILLVGLVLFAFIAFTEHKSESRQIAGLEVYVEGVSDVYFVEEKEVASLLRNAFPELDKLSNISEVSINKMEKKVEAHPLVKKAEVYQDLKGTIRVKVRQHIPMARIVRPRAADGYISTTGKILPTSPNYTSRVLILEGSRAQALLQETDLTNNEAQLLELIHFIYQDPFWTAQISSVELLRNGEVNLYQQVGRQVIEFGKPENIPLKFRKIKTFYTKILPEKGWNTYERVNVKYKDQIICE